MGPVSLTASAGPLYRRVFETLRSAITGGSLAAGVRLPATRELSRQLAVSRNTVNAAYDMLVAEGYAVSRPGSGHYVTGSLPDPPAESWAQSGHTAGPLAGRGLSVRGAILAEPSRPVSQAAGPAFQRGAPALEQFPFPQWQQHLARHSRHPAEHLLKYRDDGGLPALKAALRDYLQLARGVRCDVSQIIVVAGGQAALDLIARLLVDEGDKVAIEEPGYVGARDALRAAGAELCATPVDDAGLCVDRLGADVQLVYTTPSYQFPLGVTLSAPRRIQLLQWASRSDAFIVEDDYDSEFRYAGRPLSCMQGLDEDERVVYVGTFSKVMFPALRLGYIVAPRRIAPALAAALRKTGQDAPLLLQAAMADFISSGQFSSHIRRMRKLYARRQALFVQLAARYLGGLLAVAPTHAGMQLACYFIESIDEARLRREAAARELDIAFLSATCLGSCARPGLLLGYAGIPEAAMAPAVIALRDALLASAVG